MHNAYLGTNNVPSYLLTKSLSIFYLNVSVSDIVNLPNIVLTRALRHFDNGFFVVHLAKH